IPPASFEPLARVRRCRRDDAYRVLVPGNRNHELARMQMQAWFPETRAVAVDVVADNRPVHGCTMNAQLMGPAGDRLKREPGNAVAASQHLPVCDSFLPFRIGLLPPAALGIEAAERQVDYAPGLPPARFDPRPIV